MRASPPLAERAVRARARLAPLALVAALQAVAAIAFALTAAHRGWLYHSSPGQIEAGTAARLLGDLTLPPTDGGFAWPMLISPAVGALGPDLLHALPVLVLVGACLLAPLATLLLYLLGEALGGRLWGLWLAVAWIGLPLVAYAFWQDRYDHIWTSDVVARVLGFSATSDVVSLVAALGACVLLLRALRRPRPSFLAVGLAAGTAAAVTPANLLLLVGLVVALLVGRRADALPWLAAGLAPGLLALLVWRLRMPDGLAFDLDLSWRTFSRNADAFREFGWSERIVEAAPVAGLVGLARLSRPGAALLGGWLAGFLAFEAASSQRILGDGSLWAGLVPVAPAFVVLAASIPLLVPGLAARVAPRRPEPASWRPRPRLLAAWAAVFGAAIVWTLAADDGRLGREAVMVDGVPTPVSGALAASEADGALTWAPLGRDEVAGYAILGPGSDPTATGDVVARSGSASSPLAKASGEGLRVAAVAGVPGREGCPGDCGNGPGRAYLVGPPVASP